MCDWASVTSRIESPKELKKLLETTEKTISDAVSTSQTVRMKSAGNYLEGKKWEKFGAELKWSSETAADLIGADYDGRCVNSVNVVLKGSSGIGSLPLSHAAELLSRLQAIGFTRICRLDLSIDVFNAPELHCRPIAKALTSGDWKIPRRSIDSFTYQGPISDEAVGKKGSTLYVGARGSDVQVCMYDKGLQQQSDAPWFRMEARLRNTPAEEAFYRLQQYSDSAMESHDPVSFLDDGLVALVRGACDIRDVSKYKGRDKLPKNWASDALTSYPALMHPVFGETAPLQVGSFKAVNTFASRTRHLMRSSSKHIWRLAIISIAKGKEPGDVALTIGAPGCFEISEEDFMEMSQVSGHSIAELEKAELECHTKLLQLHGIDADCIASNRTELREQLAVTLGGV